MLSGRFIMTNEAHKQSYDNVLSPKPYVSRGEFACLILY